MATTSRNPYRALNPAARDTLAVHDIPVAAYVRWANNGTDPLWYGDACGCTDDRCIGYHHDEHADCGCLPALIVDYLGLIYPRAHDAAPGGIAWPNGMCPGSMIPTKTGDCAQCGRPYATSEAPA